eukprot:gene7732-5422_t
MSEYVLLEKPPQKNKTKQKKTKQQRNTRKTGEQKQTKRKKERCRASPLRQRKMTYCAAGGHELCRGLKNNNKKTKKRMKKKWWWLWRAYYFFSLFLLLFFIVSFRERDNGLNPRIRKTSALLRPHLSQFYIEHLYDSIYLYVLALKAVPQHSSRYRVPFAFLAPPTRSDNVVLDAPPPPVQKPKIQNPTPLSLSLPLSPSVHFLVAEGRPYQKPNRPIIQSIEKERQKPVTNLLYRHLFILMLCCSPRVSPVVAPAENGEEMTQSLLLVAEGNENSPRHVRHLVRYGADITRAPALHGGGGDEAVSYLTPKIKTKQKTTTQKRQTKTHSKANKCTCSEWEGQAAAGGCACDEVKAKTK